MRLINADPFAAMTAKQPAVALDNFDPVDADSYRKGVADILSLIDEAPTVDAVAVVRCRDCANAYSTERETRTIAGKIAKTKLLRCRKWGRYTTADGYCNLGYKEGDPDATD